MTFEVELGGRTRTVSIERAGGKYRVLLDGEPHDVDATRVGVHGLSLLVDGERGLSREVQVTSSADSDVLITFRGRMIHATVNGQRTGRAASEGSGASDGDQPVVAPMPGRVVRVLVSAGDEVELRQGVVVVEAMKMENELRSPKQGRVKSISVTPGTSVQAGRVLLVVE